MEQITANLAQNNTHLLAHSSVGQKSAQIQLDSAYKDKIQMLVRLGSFLEALGKILLLTSFGLLVECSVSRLRSPCLCWLSSWVRCLLLEATHLPSHMVPSVFKVGNDTSSLHTSNLTSATGQRKSSAFY